jgi:hypothetical protein
LPSFQSEVVENASLSQESVLRTRACQ